MSINPGVRYLPRPSITVAPADLYLVRIPDLPDRSVLHQYSLIGQNDISVHRDHRNMTDGETLAKNRD
ncbi:MAG TPA: hypothetical protein PKB07_23595 [Flavilitoribacter sp.]|nr:hypothetical protein [Flavilitoribacter sp.]